VPAPRALRIRHARGGRWFVDRRLPTSLSSLLTTDISHIFSFRRRLHEEDSGDGAKHDEERAWRLAERWKFDQDDLPAVGPAGPDEQGRVLLDDYEPRFLRHTVTLLHDQDQQFLTTDNSLIVTGSDGRMQSITPYRLGMQQPMIRRDALLGPRPMGVHPSQGGGVSVGSNMPNGTPISVQTQMKKMQPPGMSQPQQRISSNGGMRPPATPLVASMSNPPPSQSSPPQMPPPPPVLQSTNGVNGANRSPSRASDGETVKTDAISFPNGTLQNQPDNNVLVNNTSIVDHGMAVSLRSPMEPGSPALPKHSHLTVPMQNGYHLASTNGFSTMANGSPYIHLPNGQHNGLSIQQMQNLKSVFASTQMQPGQDINNMNVNGGRSLPASFMGHPVSNGNHFNMQLGAGANVNLKLPSARQPQWSVVPSPLQHNTSLGNGVDSGGMNGSMHGSMSPSPGIPQTVPGQGPPMRTPSANGSRNAMRGVPNHMMGGQPGHMSMSPYLQHSPSPNSHAQLRPTPPRPSPTPPMTMVSPSLQHQQMVGGSQGAY
jgi:enhancer of polycomb-like protein